MAMKLVAVGFLAGVPATLAQPGWANTLVNDADHIKQLNSVEGSTWTAGPNAFFDNLTLIEAHALLGTRLSHISNHLDAVLDDISYDTISNKSIPAAFDATKQWPGLMHPIRDQQECGSCWAMSASDVLSDRVAIATGKTSPALSPQDMVSCDKSNYGCSGGSLEDAWEYLESTGIVTDTCFPYTSGPGTVQACPNKCVDAPPFPWPYPWRAPEHWNQSKVTVSSAYAINGVTNMKREMMINGPIQVGFVVCPDFFSYKSGIYQLDENQYPVFFQPIMCGGHAVKMVGWGAENTGQPEDTPYWRLANSWNATWGEHGYFRILRGKDNAGVETMGPPYAGMPGVSTTSTSSSSTTSTTRDSLLVV